MSESRLAKSPEAVGCPGRWEPWLLGLLLLLALLVRTTGLNHNPDGLYCDEAANGYDGLSLLETGHSSVGEGPFPVMFQHFDGALEGLYRYLLVPAIWWSGPTPAAIRLPAAVAGTLGLLLVFLLARRLWGKAAGWLSLLFLAISPWHLHLSRIGFRVILLPTVLLGALWLLARALDRLQDRPEPPHSSGLPELERPRVPGLLLVPAGLAFGLSFHTYTTARVFVPLLLLGMFLLDWYPRLVQRPRLDATTLEPDVQPRAGWKLSAQALRALLLGLLALGLVVWPLLHAAIQHPDAFLGRTRSLVASPQDGPLELILGFVRRYLAHLSPDFLFWSGDANPRHQPAGGALYPLALLPPGLLGLWQVLQRRARGDQLLLLWLLLFPVPAALTDQGIPHALRAAQGLPVLPMLAALGTLRGYALLQAHGPRLKLVLTTGLAAWLGLSVLYQHLSQLELYPIESAWAWQHGMREGIWLAEGLQEKLRPPGGPPVPVWMSPRLMEPRAFVRLFAPIPPAEHQRFGLTQRAYQFPTQPRVLRQAWLEGEGAFVALVVPGELEPPSVVAQLSSRAVLPPGPALQHLLEGLPDKPEVLLELLGPDGKAALWVLIRQVSQDPGTSSGSTAAPPAGP